MKSSLRHRDDFKRVYEGGRRYQGSLMTVFVLANEDTEHRLGVTVSKRTAASAVARNRAKRLLRESFRLKLSSLGRLRQKYDWVLNGKHALASVKITAPLDEFERMILRVAADEGKLLHQGSRGGL